MLNNIPQEKFNIIMYNCIKLMSFDLLNKNTFNNKPKNYLF